MARPAPCTIQVMEQPETIGKNRSLVFKAIDLIEPLARPAACNLEVTEQPKKENSARIDHQYSVSLTWGNHPIQTTAGVSIRVKVTYNRNTSGS